MIKKKRTDEENTKKSTTDWAATDLTPWKEIVWKNRFGEVIKIPCSCLNRIPGLDAEACLECRIWWIDEQEREEFYRRKRSGLHHQ